MKCHDCCYSAKKLCDSCKAIIDKKYSDLFRVCSRCKKKRFLDNLCYCCFDAGVVILI